LVLLVVSSFKEIHWEGNKFHHGMRRGCLVRSLENVKFR